MLSRLIQAENDGNYLVGIFRVGKLGLNHVDENAISNVPQPENKRRASEFVQPENMELKNL